ncbi:MAG: MBL fold metallo-hydrolase [Bacteroidales bacterium]|nr:MBL fold metallo-hydrolase [Bacteroidales bacterium]
MEDHVKVCILGSGTSQGVPVVGCSCAVCQSNDPCDKRLRTSILVSYRNTTVVIDAGPDFRQQMLREKVSSLDAVVITHNHKDHTGGLDDVRAFNWIQKKPMDIFARDSVLDSIKKEFSYAFDEHKYPGVPQINLHTINNQPFIIGDMRLIPIEAMHHQMPVYGFRIGGLSYLTDASHIEQHELEKMKGSRVVIINALRKEKHISHFTLDEAIDIIRYLAPEKGLITHVSHQMGLSKDVGLELPENISLACDGMHISC